MSKAAELAALIGSQTALSNRNMIINGAMTVAQRGTSGFTTNGVYTLDRHKVYVPAASFTASQSTTSPADFVYSLKVENTSVGTPSAAQGGNIFFPLEGNTVSQLNWGTSDAKTVTLSFYVRSNTTGTYCINLENSTGTIGSGSHSYVAEYTINSANTWESKQITIPGPTVGTWATDNTMSIVIGWTLETGSNFTTATTDAWQSGKYRQTSNQTVWQQTASADFHLTGVQFEIGETSTPFEHEDYGTTLAKCQRYYQKSTEVGTAVTAVTTTGSLISRCVGTGWVGMAILPTPMRDTPTGTSYSARTGASGKAGNLSAATDVTASLGPSENTIYIVATMSNAHLGAANWELDAEL